MTDNDNDNINNNNLNESNNNLSTQSSTANINESIEEGNRQLNNIMNLNNTEDLNIEPLKEQIVNETSFNTYEIQNAINNGINNGISNVTNNANNFNSINNPNNFNSMNNPNNFNSMNNPNNFNSMNNPNNFNNFNNSNNSSNYDNQNNSQKDSNANAPKKWDDDFEKICANLIDEAQINTYLHMKSHRYFTKWSKRFQIPIIILSAVAGSGNFMSSTFGEYERMGIIIIGIVSIFTSILSSIAQYLQLAELKEGHRISSFHWEKFFNELKVQHVKRECRKVMPEFYNNLLIEYQRLKGFHLYLRKKLLTL